MSTLSTTLIVGFIIFLISALITIAVAAYYAYYTESALSKLLSRYTGRAVVSDTSGGGASLMRYQQLLQLQKSKTTKKKRNCHPVIIEWTKGRWVYMTLFTIFYLLTFLYMSMYLGQGMSPQPNTTVIIWARWIFLAVLAVPVGHCLTRVLTNTVSFSLESAQSFYFIFYLFLTFLFATVATISQTSQTRLLWFIGAFVNFLIVFLLYFFPTNMFSGSSVYTAMGQQQQQCGEYTKHQRHAAQCADKKMHMQEGWYNKILFVCLSLSAVAYLVIWLLSGSNQLIYLLSLDAEVIAYLVVDCLIFIPFALSVFVSTFKRAFYAFKISDTHTGAVSFASKAL